ncbi:hypothetical protein WJX84_000778 [Apatococcus fuscideae]|uniref:Uncharacterized protein n=1 Tax=Apatococcus fuscideae TaxID=2026836 RepID=A0AAW1SY88_9CHLO
MRMKHVGSQRESELKMLLAGMHQSQDHSLDSQWDPIDALQSLNNIIKLPGCGASAPHEQLRLQSIKGMLVHPGWNALIPCEASVHDVYLALESGQADLRVDVTGSQGQQITSLRELMAIPSHEHGPMLREIIMRVVNAQHLKTATGDVCHQNMLRNIGIFKLLCSVFFMPAAGLNIQGKNLAHGPSHDQHNQFDPFELKRSLGLDATQTKMARHVWKEASAALSRLKEERHEILSQLAPMHGDSLTQRLQGAQTASHISLLMKQDEWVVNEGEESSDMPSEPSAVDAILLLGCKLLS